MNLAEKRMNFEFDWNIIAYARIHNQKVKTLAVTTGQTHSYRHQIKSKIKERGIETDDEIPESSYDSTLKNENSLVCFKDK